MLVAGPFPGDTLVHGPAGIQLVHVDGRAEHARRPALGNRRPHAGGTAGSTRVMELGGSKPATITSTTTDIAVAHDGGLRRVRTRGPAGSRRRR